MLFEIAARDVELSDTQMTLVREMAERLTDFYDRIVSCRIAIGVPHRRAHQPVEYHVRIDVGVPGGELLVSRHASDDMLSAAQAAFEAARRRLQDHVRVQRGEVKSHAGPPTGRVAKLLPFERYGFLETHDGREIYFHANSVVNGGFQRLEVGMRVRYVETTGHDGPQASTVTPTGGRGRIHTPNRERTE
jgi:cold shock CspA family protein